MPSPRALIIGLDGAEPSLLARWMDEGRLPHLATLRDRGVFSPLRSTFPAATFPAWTTFMTGMNPGRHGLFDFTRLRHGEYAVEFVNSAHRRAPTLFRMLSDAGRRVGAMGIPSTYPPERLNGFQIAGFDSPVASRVERRLVEPPELFDEIESRFGMYAMSPLPEHDAGVDWREKALPVLLENLERKARIAGWLLEREAWDCFAVVFGEGDTASHHYWMFHDPLSPRYDAARAASLGDAILRVYQALDEAVGRLARRVGNEADVIVLSDHGFGGAGRRALYLNRWLAQNGWLRFEGGGGSLARIARRIGPRLAPRALRDAIFRGAGGRIAGGIESRARFGGIHWEATLAYSEELNYFPSIRLNIRGREPHGALAPESVDAFVGELRDAARDWRNPRSSEPYIRRILRREEAYSGPFLEEAPDLLLDMSLDDGYSYSCLQSHPRQGPTDRELDPDELPGAKNRGMNGNHRPLGALLAAGPSILPGAQLHSPGLEDVTPTILALLGTSGGAGFDGRILGEILAEGGLSRAPTATASPQPLTAPESYSPAEEERLRKRLAALGYLG